MEQDKIYPALFRAKQKFAPLHKGGDNTYFKSKYVVIDDLIEAVKEALVFEGLLFYHDTSPGDTVSLPVFDKQGGYSATTFPTLKVTLWLVHVESGQVLSSSMTAPYGDDKGTSGVQSVGKTDTYLRRYTLTNLFGIATEDDDDGQTMAQKAGGQVTKQTPKTGQKPVAPNGVLTVAKFSEEWKALFDNKDEAATRLREVMGNQSWDEFKSDIAHLAQVLTNERIAIAGRDEKKLAEELAAIAARRELGPGVDDGEIGN